MPATVDGPRFAQLIERLLARLRGEIAAGGVTVRRLARELGMSQPHMQNVVSGKRGISLELADKLLEYAAESALDLATPGELGWALARHKREREGLQLVPVGAGQLGPAHPYPELRRVADWIALPAYSLSAARAGLRRAGTGRRDGAALPRWRVGVAGRRARRERGGGTLVRAAMERRRLGAAGAASGGAADRFGAVGPCGRSTARRRISQTKPARRRA